MPRKSDKIRDDGPEMDRDDRGGFGDDVGGDDDRGLGKTRGRSGPGRRKMCRFCADEQVQLDYKNALLLRSFVTDRGKLIPRRITGNCAKHQRELATEVRRARMLAMLPIAVTGR
ncbi:MAG TPA: 30S ribosomal protein S18 [Kofleriaceae bacterium]|jgi:small subunit ribosomal protein S18|nr:30S ribosomal protein S18 [Kofleriaceae bacterium]